MQGMEFLWILRKYNVDNVEIPGVNWERGGIPRIDQENIMLNFYKSSFLALEFPRGVTQFHEICKGKALLCTEFPRVKW